MLAISNEFNSSVFHDVEFKVQHYEYSAFGKLLKIENGSGEDITSTPVIEPYFTYHLGKLPSYLSLYRPLFD